MAGGIYLVQDDQLVSLVEQPYESESVLQELLARYPDLIAGDAPRAKKNSVLVELLHELRDKFAGY